MSEEDFNVKIHTPDEVDEETITVKVKKKEDGYYINYGDGYYKFMSNTNVNKRTVRQLINKEFDNRYAVNPSNIKKYDEDF